MNDEVKISIGEKQWAELMVNSAVINETLAHINHTLAALNKSLALMVEVINAKK